MERRLGRVESIVGVGRVATAVGITLASGKKKEKFGFV